MATEDDKPNAGLIGTVAIAGAICVASISLVLTALVRTEQANEDIRKSAAANTQPLADLLAAQHKALEVGPSYVDDEKKRVEIPIDRAMAAVVKEISENPESATPPPDKPPEVADAGADATGTASDAGDAGAAKPEKPAPAPKPPAPEKQGGAGTVPPPGLAPGN